MPTTSVNPFVIARLPDAANLADREAELARITAAFREPGGKLIVYGERRLGKSATIHAAAATVRTRALPVALVNLSTASNAGEAATQILTSVHHAVGRSWTDLVKGLARRLALQITATPTPEAGGLPSVSLTLTGARASAERLELIPEVLAALETELRRQGKRLGLALDEFQQLHAWGGESAEWALKGVTETHRAISYVLAGSARALIEEMVSSKTRALWKLFDVLHMGPIEPEVLATWIQDQSHTTAIQIDGDAASRIVRLAGPRTRDVVQLARASWRAASDSGRRRVAAATVAEAFEAIVRDQDVLHRRVWATCDARSQDVLRAYAADPTVAITAADTLQRYRLGPKSSVSHAVGKLVSSELLAVSDGGRYTYDDPFFRRWVQISTLGDIGVSAPALGP